MIIDFVALVLAAVGVVFTGLVVGAVVEAVLVPGGLRELCPFNVVFQELAALDVHHKDLFPVTSAAGDGVGHVLAVVGEEDAFEGNGAVL